MNEQSRLKALPVWRTVELPADRDRKHTEAVSGFADVTRVLLRTWPFVAPLVFGYWRERAVIARSSWASRESPWSYNYVPVLVTLLVLLGPITGSLPLGENWQLDLLAGATGVMALLCWVLPFTSGRTFILGATSLVLIGSATNLFAVLVVTGWVDNIQVGLVTFGCLGMWLLQYRFIDSTLRLRFRLGSHLVYYYILVWLGMLVGIVGGLFTIDLLNQSILQAQPLTPFLAEFVGHPELADGVLTVLDTSQRQDLQRIYIIFAAVTGTIIYLLTFAIPYYNVWIMQRINQDLRLALVERWHALSLRYHGNHRVGDSVYRV